MTILKDILEHEVFPALGCTEPISRAYAVAAIVYQRCCAMKAITAVDTAIRSGFMAIDGCGLPDDDGIIGTSPESSISSRQTGSHGRA